MVEEEDMVRLVTELTHRDDPGVMLSEWAEREGISIEAFELVISSIVQLIQEGIHQTVMNRVEQIGDPDDENEDEDEEGARVIAVNIGEIVAGGVRSAFALGWEAAAQFRSPVAEPDGSR